MLERNTVATSAQVLSALASVVLFVNVAFDGLGALRASKQGRWLIANARWGSVVALCALLASVVLRGLAKPTNPGGGEGLWSTVGDRAAWIALISVVPGALSVFSNGASSAGNRRGWPRFVPAAVMSGFSVFSWGVRSWSAPVLLLSVLFSAGVMAWALGRSWSADSRQASSVGFAVLTVCIVSVVGVSWHLWGTPTGVSMMGQGGGDGLPDLAAAWLVLAAGLLLQRRSVRASVILESVSTVLLVWIALNIRWNVPFA
jgi:hypothetical protein